MQELARGAEAIIYRTAEGVRKDRVPKAYRNMSLDDQIRLRRTKREANILKKIPIPGPKVLHVDKDQLHMSFIEGDKVRDILDETPQLAKKIGQYVGMLHDVNIIHSDLTTSNMIQGKELYFIDFGLSFVSRRIEDKAVDLHLFKQALESKHWKVYEEALEAFLQGYRPRERQEILQRLEEVEERGRNKGKW